MSQRQRTWQQSPNESLCFDLESCRFGLARVRYGRSGIAIGKEGVFCTDENASESFGRQYLAIEL